MIERVSVTLSLWSGTDGLLHYRDVAAAQRRVQLLKPLDPAQRVDRGLEHVVRVIGAERLGEDVLDARRLEDGPHGAARNDARARHRRLQEHPAGAEMPGDLAGDRRVLEGHEDQFLLGVLDRLADRLRHLVGLAQTDADVAPAVPDHHQRREREPATALDDLGHPVDGDDTVVQLQHAWIDLRFRPSTLLTLYKPRPPAAPCA